MKDQLKFDTTDATSIAHSDSVGAFLRASDGTLLTHTDVSGKKALDVRIAEGLNVEVDLDHADDSVALGDGTDLFTSTTVGSDIGLDVYILNSSIAVTATDLDIRDLTQTDEVTVFQGTSPWLIADGGNSITVDAIDLDIRDLTQTDEITVYQGTNPWEISDGGNSITVDAADLDIRDLSHVSDSISLGDGTDLFTSTTVGSDIGLDVYIINSALSVNDAALANTAIASAALVLGAADTAQNIVSSVLADRKYLFIRNNDNKQIYIGQSGVTAANGFPLSPGSVMELRAGAAMDIEFVGSSGETPAIRTMQLS